MCTGGGTIPTSGLLLFLINKHKHAPGNLTAFEVHQCQRFTKIAAGQRGILKDIVGHPTVDRPLIFFSVRREEGDGFRTGHYCQRDRCSFPRLTRHLAAGRHCSRANIYTQQ